MIGRKTKRKQNVTNWMSLMHVQRWLSVIAMKVMSRRRHSPFKVFGSPLSACKKVSRHSMFFRHVAAISSWKVESLVLGSINCSPSVKLSIRSCYRTIPLLLSAAKVNSVITLSLEQCANVREQKLFASNQHRARQLIGFRFITCEWCYKARVTQRKPQQSRSATSSTN